MDGASDNGTGPLEAPAKSHRRPFLARFFSTSFEQPIGSRVEPGTAAGYYLDVRIKAKQPSWPESWPAAPGAVPWVVYTQTGLGAHERYLGGEGDEWLAYARSLGERIVAAMRSDGALVHTFAFPHTYALSAPWISGMAQGQAASLFARLARATGEERWAESAARVIDPLFVPSSEGGAMALLGGRPFPEEYPTQPGSFVLNGGIFAMWGMYDVGTCLGDAAAAQRANEAFDTLAANLGRWDTGSWSRYDLFPHRVQNIASGAYHTLHIDQLRVTNTLAPRAPFVDAADRFESYTESRTGAAQAFARKALFRVVVPRNERLAQIAARLPGGTP
jgi:hypothetical protein